MGDDEDDNPEVRRWGTPRDFAAEGIADEAALGPGRRPAHASSSERAVKLAAQPLRPAGRPRPHAWSARIINFMADTHTSRGYTEWWCPAMANADTLTGTGQLPKFEDDLFKTT